MESVRAEVHLETAWRARFDGNVDLAVAEIQAVQKFLKIQSHFSLKEIYLTSLLESKLPLETLNSWVALSSWLLRINGSLEEAEELIQFAYRKTISLGRLTDFYLEFQRANLAHRKSDYAKAHQLYLSAKKIASRVDHQVIALGNSLYALEAMGLPFESTYHELRLLLESYPVSERTLIRTVYEQFEVFQNRQWLWMGYFLKIFNHYENSEFKTTADQTFWQMEYFSQLPYHSRYLAEMNTERLSSIGGLNLEAQFYRNTLLGIRTEEDFEKLRLHLIADRIYLWTWRWLVDPATMPLAKLDACLQLLLKVGNRTGLGSGDYYQISIALKWVKLMNGYENLEVDAFLRYYQPTPLRPIPSYELEMLGIHFLHAVFSNNDEQKNKIRMRFESEFEKSSDENFFRDLFTDSPHAEMRPEAWLQFLGRLQRIRSEQTSRLGVIQVDALRSSIQYFKSEIPSQIVSQILTRGFVVLTEQSHYTCAEFCARVFGYQRYSEDLHLSKIFNLLSRLRSILPDSIRVGVKDGCVYRQGNWALIRLISRPVLSAQSKPRKMKKTLSSQESFQKIKKDLPHLFYFKRTDIEENLSVSRATANRLIEQWESSGKIKKTGFSKNIRYQLMKGDHP